MLGSLKRYAAATDSAAETAAGRADRRRRPGGPVVRRARPERSGLSDDDGHERAGCHRDARNDPFDLLLTDVNMPQMTGDELARRLRHDEPTLKVLYLTGYSDQLFKDKNTLWQDEAFLEKPCTIAGLLQAVALITVGHV